jgi:hypothetical protein
MNWRSGLFRTWVVLSALWIAGWALYGFAEWRHGTFLVTDPNGLKFDVTAPTGTSEHDVLEFVRNSDVAKKRQEACAKEFGP